MVSQMCSLYSSAFIQADIALHILLEGDEDLAMMAAAAKALDCFSWREYHDSIVVRYFCLDVPYMYNSGPALNKLPKMVTDKLEWEFDSATGFGCETEREIQSEHWNCSLISRFSKDHCRSEYSRKQWSERDGVKTCKGCITGRNPNTAPVALLQSQSATTRDFDDQPNVEKCRNPKIDSDKESSSTLAESNAPDSFAKTTQEKGASSPSLDMNSMKKEVENDHISADADGSKRPVSNNPLSLQPNSKKAKVSTSSPSILVLGANFNSDDDDCDAGSNAARKEGTRKGEAIDTSGLVPSDPTDAAYTWYSKAMSQKPHSIHILRK